MELNNNQLVAMKEEVKHEVLALAEPAAADSQVVMRAGEDIKVEMFEDPTDESADEADSAVVEDEDPYDPSTNLLLEVVGDGQVVMGGDVGDGNGEDSDGSSILVSLFLSVLMLCQLAASQDVACLYGPGGECHNTSPIRIAALETDSVSPVAMWPGGKLPPRFRDTSDEEAEGEESEVGDEDVGEVDETVGDLDEIVGMEDVGDTPVSVVKEEVKEEPLDRGYEASYSFPCLFISSYIIPFIFRLLIRSHHWTGMSRRRRPVMTLPSASSLS